MYFFGFGETLYRVPDVWGAASIPEKAARELQLDTHLQAVRLGGTVLDVGAGIGLSLEAAIFLRRPDISVIALDPGFHLPEFNAELEENLEVTIFEKGFDEEQQAKIVRSKQWSSLMVAAWAEDIPLRDGSVDLVVSYASLPEYVFNRQHSLSETLRVLRPGGVSLNGPMSPSTFNIWSGHAFEALASGQITDFSCREEVIEAARGQLTEVFFTDIVK